MTISQLQIQEFKEFFTGSQHNFGELNYSTEKNNKDSKGKVLGSCRTVTDKLITIQNYKDHLLGNKGLGVIPITEGNKCRFAAIDVDIYDKNLMIYVNAIERGKFPLVPFRSKSGGLHLYMFLKEEESPKQVVELMRRFSFLLSIDLLVKRAKNESVEIFPKQFKLKQGEYGSWINLPYYNYKNTQSYAIKEGAALTLNQALLLIRERRTTMSNAQEFLDELQFNDAPPCLQLNYLLNSLGKHSGRNNYLFSFGVYLKKKDEDFFEQNLRDINSELPEPLPEKELEKTVLNSLRKKDYVYKCKESPCIDFCHKKECSKREFGIGKNDGYFSSVEFGKLYQYRIAQPYYEWEVRLQGQKEFKKLRFHSEDEIIKQDAFLRLCMRELHELPSKLKQWEWFNRVNQALSEIEIVDINSEDDTSPIYILKGLIVEFLTERAMAETKDQIFTKRVYFDNDTSEYLFRIKDLQEFLYVQKKFKYFQPGELHGILREYNCKYKTIRTERKKQVRVGAFLQKDLNLNEKDASVFNPDFSKFAEEDF